MTRLLKQPALPTLSRRFFVLDPNPASAMEMHPFNNSVSSVLTRNNINRFKKLTTANRYYKIISNSR